MPYCAVLRAPRVTVSYFPTTGYYSTFSRHTHFYEMVTTLTTALPVARSRWLSTDATVVDADGVAPLARTTTSLS